jgi:predicted O-methyltransferase YrrM
MSMRASLRRLGFGLATVLGLARRGWFIPYRYTGRLPEDAGRRGFPAVEAAFAASVPAFIEAIADIERVREAITAIAADRDPDAPQPRPRWNQDWFPPLDAVYAYALLRRLKPRRIVEVGSGHSTRILARAVHDGGFEATITAVDPAPRADLKGLAVRGRPVEWLPKLVQQAGPEPFKDLRSRDVLFIDSSHVLMPGSDVDYLLNHVLPALEPGVHVHIHDIFLPDPYPAEWGWRGYNEQNALAPLILGGGWRVVFASRFVETRLTKRLRGSVLGELPNPSAAPSTSLWLARVEPLR